MSLSTEGLARTSSNHPWTTIGVWAVIIVAALVANSTLLADSLTTEFKQTGNPDSKRADLLMEERLRGPKKSRETIIVQSESRTVDDEVFQTRVEEIYEKVIGLGKGIVDSGTNFDSLVKTRFEEVPAL